jgi:hypothetical protein
MIFLEELLLKLRDARTTLGKTATCRDGSEEVTIQRSFFDSAIRNLDAAIRALASKDAPQ